ncbi:GPN-loop GTPase 2 [Wickerhamomyces ciferrii]|uniref:GPN-loop GTPase 2 n=1 Tax=Wickerhamomyces ciferrii (strain ATCC 14091 / BCRC 22168 / CBS 111 / JCM 3599 / NBRC 0793 / NRRL Y-1031 F-60-10) TaxID=1206466 RepID=K0KP84_WICCF|nr:GPN-loop GTPase 2 [Wickerhamomyces ciferrii]CCH42938.1 GPN-loop GTPase 2 [Wickerhamomyces ciferrii]
MPFGQIVIGPPGSGKSTYCDGVVQFFNAIGRKSAVINLDPANDRLSYDCELDIRDFITLEDIMEEENLGPNGGLMYALESLDDSLDLLIKKITKISQQSYILFDCPGQVELFTHHSSLQKIFKALEKQLDMRFCVVSLIDSYYLTSPAQYISVLLLALRSMLQLDLPHVNVFSKIDLVSNYGELPFSLDYYTEVQDLSYLKPHIEQESNSVLGKRYQKLTNYIAELVEDFNLVSFEVLSVEDKQSMINLLTVIDKANGYMFGTTEVGGDTIWAEATRQGGMTEVDIQDRWIDNKAKYEAEEAKRQKELMEEAENQADLFE